MPTARVPRVVLTLVFVVGFAAGSLVTALAVRFGLWPSAADDAEPRNGETVPRPSSRVGSFGPARAVSADAPHECERRSARNCCKALERCLSREALRVEEWPDDLPVGEAERPEHWTQVVADAIEACDVPGELVHFDCSAYPCMAVLRFEDREASDEVQREAITEKWRSCKVVAEGMGWGGEAVPRRAADLEWIDAPACSHRHAAVLFAVAPDGAAGRLNALGLEGIDDPQWVEIAGSVLTRQGQAMREWLCEDAPPAPEGATPAPPR